MHGADPPVSCPCTWPSKPRSSDTCSILCPGEDGPGDEVYGATPGLAAGASGVWPGGVPGPRPADSSPQGEGSGQTGAREQDPPQWGTQGPGWRGSKGGTVTAPPLLVRTDLPLQTSLRKGGLVCLTCWGGTEVERPWARLGLGPQGQGRPLSSRPPSPGVPVRGLVKTGLFLVGQKGV